MYIACIVLGLQHAFAGSGAAAKSADPSDWVAREFQGDEGTRYVLSLPSTFRVSKHRSGGRIVFVGPDSTTLEAACDTVTDSDLKRIRNAAGGGPWPKIDFGTYSLSAEVGSLSDAEKGVRRRKDASRFFAYGEAISNKSPHLMFNGNLRTNHPEKWAHSFIWHVLKAFSQNNPGGVPRKPQGFATHLGWVGWAQYSSGEDIDKLLRFLRQRGSLVTDAGGDRGVSGILCDRARLAEARAFLREGQRQGYRIHLYKKWTAAPGRD